jgi:hypothetical protein
MRTALLAASVAATPPLQAQFYFGEIGGREVDVSITLHEGGCSSLL